jgi:hypothetical protein
MSLLYTLENYKPDFFQKKIQSILELKSSPACPPLALVQGLIDGLESEKTRQRFGFARKKQGLVSKRQAGNLLDLYDRQSLEVMLFHIAMGHAAAAITLTGSDRNPVPIFDIAILKLFLEHQRPQDTDKALAMIYGTTAYSVVALSALDSLTSEELETIRLRSAKTLAKSKRPEFADGTIDEQRKNVEIALRHKIQMLLFLTAQMSSGELKKIAAQYIPRIQEIAPLSSETDLNIYAIDGDVAKGDVMESVVGGRVLGYLDRRTDYQLQAFDVFASRKGVKTKISPQLEQGEIIITESDLLDNVYGNADPLDLRKIPMLPTILNVIGASGRRW